MIREKRARREEKPRVRNCGSERLDLGEGCAGRGGRNRC